MFVEYLLAASALAGFHQDTDTTFAVGDATRLDVESMGGEIVVEGWDQDEIRIVAEHSRRAEIDIRRSGRTFHVEAEGPGPSGVVDYRISVPSGLDVSIEGFQTSISVTGVSGEVEAETFQGSVYVVGGSGSVDVSSVNGEIVIDGARGRVSAEGVSGSISIRNTGGRVSAETVSGSVLMAGMSATSVEAETVSGRIEYGGTIAPQGDYFFGSHSGRVILELPRETEAELQFSTLSGSISIDHRAAAGARIRSGDRSRILMGEGGSSIEVETFSGRILIRELTRNAPGGGGGR